MKPLIGKASRSAPAFPGSRLPEAAATLRDAAKVIVLSPHSDDIAFSIPGTLWRLADEKIPVELITCFSVSAFMTLDATLDAEEVTALRKAEDERYSKSLGSLCSLVFLDLKDAPLRGCELSTVCTRGPLCNADFQLAATVFEKVHLRLSPGSVLFAPLGIGNHIDHRIVHEAGKRFLAERDCPTVFYEEIPYALHLRSRCITKAARNATVAAGCHAVPIFTTHPRLLAIKIDAAQCYPTQVGPAKAAKILEDPSYRWCLSRERLWKSTV